MSEKGTFVGNATESCRERICNEELFPLGIEGKTEGSREGGIVWWRKRYVGQELWLGVKKTDSSDGSYRLRTKC